MITTCPNGSGQRVSLKVYCFVSSYQMFLNTHHFVLVHEDYKAHCNNCGLRNGKWSVQLAQRENDNENVVECLLSSTKDNNFLVVGSFGCSGPQVKALGISLWSICI